MYAPVAPALDSYALESEVSSLSEVSSFYATKTSVNTKAPFNNPEFTGIITAPNINATTALQINGTSTNTLYQQRAWIQAILPSAAVNGAVTVTAQNGSATITSVNRTAVGTYAISWSPSIGSNNYIVQGNVRNSAGFLSFSGTTATTCNILTYNASGTLADISAGCHIMIFRMTCN